MLYTSYININSIELNKMTSISCLSQYTWPSLNVTDYFFNFKSAIEFIKEYIE